MKYYSTYSDFNPAWGKLMQERDNAQRETRMEVMDALIQDEARITAAILAAEPGTSRSDALRRAAAAIAKAKVE